MREALNNLYVSEGMRIRSLYGSMPEGDLRVRYLGKAR